MWTTGKCFVITYHGIRIRCKDVEENVKPSIQNGPTLAVLGLEVKLKFHDSAIHTSWTSNAAAADGHISAWAVAFPLSFSLTTTICQTICRLQPNMGKWQEGGPRAAAASERREEVELRRVNLPLLLSYERTRMSHQIFPFSPAGKTASTGPALGYGRQENSAFYMKIGPNHPQENAKFRGDHPQEGILLSQET